MNYKMWLLVLVSLLFPLNACNNARYLSDSYKSDVTLDTVHLLSEINYTYETYFSPKSNYSTCLYLSPFLIDYEINSNITFDNGLRKIVYCPEKTKVKRELDACLCIVSGNSALKKCISFKRRITPGHLSKDKKPRILVIGDSMTSGYGSSSNKSKPWYPNEYWAFAKMFFELEKIDNGDNEKEYNSVFIGCKSDGSFKIDYKGINRTVRARAEGYGGAALQQLFNPIFGNENRNNPFYDSDKNSFSIQSYLKKYRTMDDRGFRLVSSKPNPSGVKVKGSDGKDYEIGSEITTQELLENNDVCTPSIIVINLCHNTSLDDYKSNIGKVVRILRDELPDTKIVIMTIGEAGTFFPADYPNYIESELLYGELHEKNAMIYNYVRGNVEDEKNDVYLLATQFIMPTAESLPTIEKNGINSKNPNVIGQHYHPNNRAHKACGYALYSMIKYLITD